MPSRSIRSSVAAVTLLLSMAACAGNATQDGGQAPTAPVANEPAPSVGSALKAPPTLDISSSAGISAQFIGAPVTPTAPSGSFYEIAVRGAGYPVGSSYREEMKAVWLDGTVSTLSGAGGMNPSDGSFRTEYRANCPSYIREVYDIVYTAGLKIESKHIVPAC